MTWSDCVECSKPAHRYWGTVAVCKRCFDDYSSENPSDHECPTCGEVQPPNVSWHRNAPCKKCQKART